MIYAFIKKGSFQDSVSLMIISRKLSERPEVDQVSVMMGTPANKAMLDSTGFWHDDFAEATPNDICVAVRTQEARPGILDLVREQLEKELSAIANASGSSQQLLKARRWESACQKSCRRPICCWFPLPESTRRQLPEKGCWQVRTLCCFRTTCRWRRRSN